MEQNKKTVAIIAAAGLGKRMGSGIPKQYMKIGGEPILLKTVKAFCRNEKTDEIYIVTNEEYIDYCLNMKEQYHLDKVKAVVKGGKERQDSVFCALEAVERCTPDAGWILVHDGARPFIRQETIDQVADAAAESGAAVACVPVKDSIRQQTEDGGSRNLPRETLYAVQTPQGFEKDLLRSAYEKAFAEGFYGTDDAGLVERMGHPVKLVMGQYDNIKVTTREDMPMESRVGSGYDVHRLVEGRKLILGGVEIPFEKGLLGHSDADVLLHALMDALLGAASLGDIGRHFPDTDQAYKDASSMVLLSRVNDKIKEAGYRVGNVDVTLIAQRPKIKSYIDDMINNIAAVLEIEPDRINLKGTTTEKLGFEGREEGIAAQAVCLLYR